MSIVTAEYARKWRTTHPLTDEQKKAQLARWRKWYAKHHPQSEAAQNYQEELFASKQPPARTHKGYPPDNKCPCRECRDTQREQRGDFAKVLMTDIKQRESMRRNYNQTAAGATD
jgi:hypothetical protein